MIRILHYIGGIGLGGSQTLVMELYRKIDKRKLQFDFVVFEDQYDDNGYKSEIESLGGKIFICPRYSAKNHYVFCEWWNRFFEKHSEYRIIHGHVYSCAAVYLPIAKRHGLITICHAHSTSNGGNRILEAIKRIYEYPIRYIADYLFACSTDSGNWLYGNKATKKENYKVILNCIDVAKFNYSPAARNGVREIYGIKEDDFVIGHVGSFRAAKNHEFIICVFKEIRKKCNNAVLMLVGIGEMQDYIKQMCSDLGLGDSVIFAGNQHDIASYYCSMDCFFFPSLWEGLPVSVVEAQASGLNCIISDTITKDVHSTDLVHSFSPEDSADTWAKELLKFNSAVRKPISSEQKEKLMKFDSEETARWLQDFYLNLVEE